MNLQQFFAMSLGLSVENIYYIAIAVLACILGAEIAGICMLIGKLRRARSGKNDAQNDEFNMGGGANYAIAAISFGAVSATLELVLLVLAIAAAVGAFVLCALLVVLYAKGYLLISKKVEKTAQEQPATPAYAAQEETYEEVAADEQYTEEPDYTDYTESDVDAQQAIDELMDDGVEDTAVVTEAPNTAVVENAQTVERTVITQGAPVYGGQAPVIEKHIIETTREIIKETNTTTVTEDKNTNPVTEEMRKAIDELKQLGLQLRMEREVAVVHPVQENGEAIDADEDELDELDAEDELDVEDEAEREADAEENDDEYESDLFGNERIVGFDEETGCYIIARYRKSCEAKLMQSRPATKKYYSAIRNALMGYEGTKERMSWSIDTYTNDHTQIAKINIRPRTLDLYLALEPSTLEDSVYRGRDVGGKKKYAETPFLYKVNSPRKLALALELVQRTCEEQGLSPIDIEEVNYEEQYPFTDTETLITRGLIREYLREEKPAATFELDPDHVPQLAEEDETVIPANANFTWEFDNDQPEVVEVVEEEPVATEEPIEEPVAEEVVVEEPVPAAPVSGTTTTTTTHETIRTTERHYTERYYSTGTQINAIEETRTVEVLPEATAEPVEAEAEEVVEENSEVQSAVAALFGDDVNQEDEPIVDEPAPEVVEEVAEEEIEEEIIEEVYEEETVEEPEEIYEEVVEVEEEIVEEEPVEEIEEEIVEEYYEEEPEAEDEEEYYEEVVEEYYEEEPEAEGEEEYYEEVVEEYYEEEPEAEDEEEYYEEVVEEYYEEEPETEGEEEYYEEVVEEYYEEEPEAEEEEYYEEVVEEYYEEEPQKEYEEEYFDEELVEEYYEEEEVEEEIVEEVEEEVEEEVVEEEPAPQPVSDVVLLDVCLFDDYFDNGAIINLETLKQVGLAHEGATRLKVYASGALKGQFTVEANHFTLDAIKAIGDADGDSIMIR